jgi:selenide, water dikinase
MPPILDENVLVGLSTSDDAAVYRVNDDLAIVLTVDYFTPLVDDACDFGRIAAANALSDAYAMGATPVIALNLIGFPAKLMPLDVMKEILKGGSEIATKAGVSIVGGHSIDDPEPKYGMVVMGFVHPDKVMSNAAARAGDVIFLTKPLGTGIIATAIKDEAASPELIERAILLMTTLNKDAAEAMKRVGANSCTDVTGFGLLGHLHEMTWGSGVGAVIDLSAIPAIEGVDDLLKQDMAPGGTRRNLQFLESCGILEWDAGITEEQKLLLCDAQTSGGLLISVPEDRADRMQSELTAPGIPVAARIGRIVEDPNRTIRIRK